jgi:hypothetical protein
MTSSGIEPATFRLEAQHFHQLRYSVAHHLESSYYEYEYCRPGRDAVLPGINLLQIWKNIWNQFSGPKS